MYTLNISLVPSGVAPLDLIAYVRDELAPAVEKDFEGMVRFGRVIDVDGRKLDDPNESTFSLQLRFQNYADAVRHEKEKVHPALVATRAHFGSTLLCMSMIVKTIML